MPRVCLFFLLLYGVARDVSAQLFADFEKFADGQSHVMFQNPRRISSTVDYLSPTPDISVITSSFPAGDNSTRALKAQFSFNGSGAAPWLRLTTLNTFGDLTALSNPTIDFNKNLTFKIYADRPIKLGLGVLETDTSAPIGADGSSGNLFIGEIEWIGVKGAIGGGPFASPLPTRTIAPGKWTRVTFDIDAEPITASVTGDGVLDKGPTGKGVLEHLAIVPQDGTGVYTIYVDDFAVTTVPEPAAYGVCFGVLALAGAVLRKNARKLKSMAFAHSGRLYKKQ